MHDSVIAAPILIIVYIQSSK